MKIKKLLSAASAAVLTAALSVSFSGCGTTDNSSGTDAKYTVGICQLTQHEALDAATEGFRAALEEKLGDDEEFNFQNASGETTNCTTITNQFVSSGVDLIMANGTSALQSAATATGDIPILGTSISHYGTALDISDWTGKTGRNISGTSDLAPLDQQAAMLTELFPEAKKVGILYCSAEANSKYQATEITKYLKESGLEVSEYTFADSNDITSVVTTACGEVDVIYIPTDNKAADNTEIINSVASDKKIPIIAGEEGICKGCGVATLSINYYDIGYKTGAMAYEILVNGADPADMEVELSKDLTKKYVKDRAEALNVTIPDGYTAISE